MSWVIRAPKDVGPPPGRVRGADPDEPKCDHPRTELRLKTIGSVGVRHARVQCLTCGASIRAVRKNLIPCFDSLPAFDEPLRVAWREKATRYYAARRERERAEWWAWYDAYLNSPQWHRLRERVLARDGGVCRAVGCSRPAAQVHHLTYERVGSEELSDLVAVCSACHDACHPKE